MLFPSHLPLAFRTITRNIPLRSLVHYLIEFSLLCCLFAVLLLGTPKMIDKLDLGEQYSMCTELGMPLCDYLDVNSLLEMRPTKHDLSVMQLNIRGLLNKQDQLKELINESQVESILLC